MIARRGIHGDSRSRDAGGGDLRPESRLQRALPARSQAAMQKAFDGVVGPGMHLY